MAHNTTLQKAVRYLYGHGVISKDKEVADKTGYNKATVSSYISGRTKVSDDFVHAFEKAFKVRLEDFQEGGALDNVTVANPMQVLTEKVLQVMATVRVNQSLLTELLALQTGKTVTEVQRAISAATAAETKQLLAELRQLQKG